MSVLDDLGAALAATKALAEAVSTPAAQQILSDIHSLNARHAQANDISIEELRKNRTEIDSQEEP